MFDYQFISELLQSLLLAVLVPLAGFGANLLITWAKQKKAEMGENQQALIDGAVRIAVFAAEQVYKAGHGDDKKAYAIKAAQEWLAQHNIYLDVEVLESAVEAAVYDELNRWSSAAHATVTTGALVNPTAG